MTARRFFALFLLSCCTPCCLWAADLERINRTSFAAGGTQPGTMAVDRGAYSADGRYLLFASSATAVIPGVVDQNGAADLFVKDVESGATRLVTARSGSPARTADRGAAFQKISAGGNVVIFASLASDLVPLDIRPVDWLLYWHDLASGATRLINHPAGQPAMSANGNPFALDVSADGRFVIFESRDSASLFVPGATDTNNQHDLFIWDSQNDTFQLVSHVAGDPLLAPAAAYQGANWRLSADGRYVAFLSTSASFVGPDTGGLTDAFVYDRTDGSHQLASHSSAGPTSPANGHSSSICALSPEGRFLLFKSNATNLAAGITDSNGAADDVFLFDRVTGGVELISRRPAPASATGNAGSYCGWLSSDARWVYFLSSAGDLVAGMTDASSEVDLFLRDRSSGETRLVTRRWDAPAISAGGAPDQPDPFQVSGRGIAAADASLFYFTTDEPSLVDADFAGSHPWSVRYDRDQDGLALGLETIGNSGATLGNRLADASADGTASVHATYEAAALAAAPGTRRDEAQLVERRNAVANLVAPAAYSGTGSPSWPLGQPDAAAVSGDGRRVVFDAGSGEVCGPSDQAICAYDRQDGSFENLNHAAGSASPLDSEMLLLDLAGPRHLLVETAAPLLPGDLNGTWDLYRLDLDSPEVVLVSSQGAGSSSAANASSRQTSQFSARLMSADGGRIAFETTATNLDPNVADGNGRADIYLKTVAPQPARFDLVSHQAGNLDRTANGKSEKPLLAASGAAVYFLSEATDLVAGFADGNGAGWDLYAYENTELVLVTHAAGASTQGGNQSSHFIDLLVAPGSASWMAFHSPATNLVAGADSNGDYDVFLWNGPTRLNTLVSHRLGDPLAAANRGSRLNDISADGRWVLFESEATDLVAGLAGAATRLFLWDRNDGGVRLVSHQRGAPGVAVSGRSGRLSADGSRVYFLSDSPEVIPGIADLNQKTDVFLWEKENGNLRLLTPRYGDPTRTGQGDCSLNQRDVLLDDAAGILFTCVASDLLPNDNNGSRDLFLLQLPFFEDGFESGTTGGWSLTVP